MPNCHSNRAKRKLAIGEQDQTKIASDKSTMKIEWNGTAIQKKSWENALI